MDSEVILPYENPLPLSLPDIQTYKCRWFVVGTLALLTMANGMLWISYAPITDITALAYNATEMEVNALSLVFPVTTVALALPVAWLNDVIGLRATLITSGWLNCLAAVLRIISSLKIDNAPSMLFYGLVLAGQIVASLAQPLLLFSSTKVAAIWFPQSQRALANTIGSISNPLGIMIANIVVPYLATINDRLFLLNIVIGAPSIVGALLATFGICRSVPPSPPSESAMEAEVPPGQFWSQMKSAVRCQPFIVLSVCFGMGMGMFTALSTLIQQILCVRGYTDSFSGLCGALLIGVGVVGAGIVGPVVDRTKCFLEVVKVCFGLATVGLIVFAVLQGLDVTGCNEHDISGCDVYKIPIAVSIGWLGCFGFAMYATALELGVECTYPVGETISTALLIFSGQIVSVLFIVGMQLGATPYTGNVHLTSCQTGTQVLNFRIPVFVMAGASILVVLLTVFGLNTEYRRARVESHAREEKYRVQIASGSASTDNLISASGSIYITP